MYTALECAGHKLHDYAWASQGQEIPVCSSRLQVSRTKSTKVLY